MRLLFLIASVCVLSQCAQRSIPVTGGQPMVMRPKNVVHYAQRDERWAHLPLLRGRYYMSEYGCVVCDSAMALTFLGHPMNPAQVQQGLWRVHGFNADGEVIWEGLEQVANQRIQVKYIPSPSHRQIDRTLRQGGCVITKFPLRNGSKHWALIVGKQGQDYLILDSLDRQGRLLPLSQQTSRIEAIRCVLPK